MSPILPALLFILACAAPNGDAMNAKTLFARDLDIELTAKPAVVTLDLGDARARALEIARDPNRRLVLRVEGISATKQPGVTFEVRVGDQPVGVLALYGIEEDNGQYVAGFAIDEAAQRALGNDRGELRLIFTPQAVTDENGRPQPIELQGRVFFTRLRLVEE